MRRLVLTSPAHRAFKDILRHSRDRFGDVVRDRYLRLLIRAFADLRADPQRRGVQSGPGRLHRYHLRHSRRAIPASDRIARPRHFIVFRFDAETVEVIHLLHEAMDLPARLSR